MPEESLNNNKYGNRIIKKIIFIIDIITIIVNYNNISVANSYEENKFRDVISTYSTSFSEDNIDRSTNIKISSEKINNTIINPGQIFSFNEILGERTGDKRIQKSTSILKWRDS